jgi:hypothetical protein
MQMPEAAPEPAATWGRLAGQAPPAADVPKEKPEKVGNGSREIPINLDEGEYDPGIIALAKEAGATPRCLVEDLRVYMELLEYMEINPQFNPMHDKYEHANPVSEQCKQESRDRLTPKPLPLYEVSNPTYEQYTNEQLEALAPYEADAAILLARRIEDDRTSRTYYELATHVTQDAKPLDEWLLTRAFVEYNNDMLNVELARLGYETALIANAQTWCRGGSRLADFAICQATRLSFRRLESNGKARWLAKPFRRCNDVRMAALGRELPVACENVDGQRNDPATLTLHEDESQNSSRRQNRQEDNAYV